VSPLDWEHGVSLRFDLVSRLPVQLGWVGVSHQQNLCCLGIT
jgi:hypothetical protein